MDRMLAVFHPDFHFTFYTKASSGVWSIRGQNRTLTCHRVIEATPQLWAMIPVAYIAIYTVLLSSQSSAFIAVFPGNN